LPRDAQRKPEAAVRGSHPPLRREACRVDHPQHGLAHDAAQAPVPGGIAGADQVIEQIEISARYAGYVVKQDAEVERNARADSTPLPHDFDFASVRALSFEVRQVLELQRPSSLGAAARLPGVTPAAISLLMVHMKRHRQATAAERDRHPLRLDA